MDDRREIDIQKMGLVRKIAVACIAILLAQALAGIVTAVQVIEQVKENSKDIAKNTETMNKDGHTLIRVEVQLQQVTEDVQEIKTDAKETRRLIRKILTEVRK